MIDAGTNIGLSEIPLSADPTLDVSETGDMNANAKAIMGINPHTSHVNIARVNGITTVLSAPEADRFRTIRCYQFMGCDARGNGGCFDIFIGYQFSANFDFFICRALDRNSSILMKLCQRDRRMEDLKKIFKARKIMLLPKMRMKKTKLCHSLRPT